MQTTELMNGISPSPLKKLSLKDRVADVIRESILAGKLESGDRIVELKLAKDLGIGTTAVREALLELESEGFVTRLANKGTFVTRLNLEEIEQSFRVRRDLEGLAIELFQQRATAADIVALETLVDQMRAAATTGDLDRFYQVDLEFHRAIWNFSGNRPLVKCLNVMVVPLFAFFIMKNRKDSKEHFLVSVEKHSGIVRSLRKGENARACMESSITFFWEQEEQLLIKGS
jgi:DNA-binding GntR family transcriptional regulator